MRPSGNAETMKSVRDQIVDTLGIKTIRDEDAMELAVASARWLEVFGLGESIGELGLSQASDTQMVLGRQAFGTDASLNFDAKKVQEGVMVRGSISTTREDLLIRQVSLYTTFTDNGEMVNTRCRMVLNTTRGPRYVTLLQPIDPNKGQIMDLRFTNESDAEVEPFPKSMRELSNLTVKTLPQFLAQVVKEFE